MKKEMTDIPDMSFYIRIIVIMGIQNTEKRCMQKIDLVCKYALIKANM